MEILSVVRLTAGLAIGIISLVFLLSKCFFLAPCRIGWLMMFANVLYDTVYKKLHLDRGPVEFLAYIIIVVGWAVVAGPEAGLAVALVCGLAWAAMLMLDLKWRGGEMARQDSRYAWQVPLPIPRLIMVVRGPVLSRGKTNDLGDWPQDHEDKFDCLILNPSLVVPQFPMKVEIIPSNGLVQVADGPKGDLKTPEPEQYAVVPFRLKAVKPALSEAEGAGGTCTVRVRLTHGDYVREEVLRVRIIPASAPARVEGAEIRKWKGGARAGLGWRGDQDLFDPATFQSVEGLRMALALSKRFFLPSTLYLSARLSLVPEEHRAFCKQFGWDRRTEWIPEFIRFLKEDVEIKAEMEFPHTSARPYYMEVGNHMYVHYGTHAAADPGNNWTWGSSIGDGTYPWQGAEKDPFSEQRDNVMKCRQVYQEVLGLDIRSYAVPGRDYDENTSRSAEAAGMAVGSDTDASAWTNVMTLPKPHHPAGCDHLVDITKKYPGDSNYAYKIAMLKYWMHAARRTGRVFLYMAHHHLLRYFDNACYFLTEEFFRYALGDCHGDYYVATVSAMAAYWDRVLCPKHRAVRIRFDEKSVTVENTGDVHLDRLPLEIDLAGGKRFMTLVDVPAKQSVTVKLG